MSSPKKTSIKTKSPAPATKPTTSKPAAAKKVAAQPTTVAAAAPVKPAAVAPVTSRPAPAPAKPLEAAVAKPAPAAVKPVSAKPQVTEITARVDVGFGNALFIRGEGPDLSWEKGLPMECAWSDSWVAILGESPRPYTFKFLINDVTWSTGADYTAVPGSNVTLTPQF